ncbi:MAG: hypothetical protein P1U63_10710 [Coxiellaceae bacterium]|nr:hypothetical protein [Coxiellaceae bacterium]
MTRSSRDKAAKGLIITGAGAGARARAAEPAETHRMKTFCGPTKICVKTRLEAEILEAHHRGISATLVDRGVRDAPSLMRATKVYGVLSAGESINLNEMVEITADVLARARKRKLPPVIFEPKELVIVARWLPKDVEVASTGSNATVFDGGLGVLAVDPAVDVIDIPKMNALSLSPAYLKSFGATLIPIDQTVCMAGNSHEDLQTLYATEYTWKAGYVDKFVMDPTEGGGVFVETHPFEHFFAPLGEDSCGGLILGKMARDGSDRVTLISVEIPLGFSLRLDADAIHGDSFFVGRYLITLTETELADSVILKRDNAVRTIQPIKQTCVYTRLGKLNYTERLLSKAITCKLVDDFKRATCHIPLGFFRALPRNVLPDVRAVSPEAQSAYDECYGIVVSPKK